MSSERSEVARLFQAATRLLQEGDLAGAEAAYRDCLKLNPDLAEAHANLAFVLEKDRRRDEAEASYLTAIRLDPARTGILVNFGAMLMSQKRFAEAEALLRRALAIDDRCCPAWSNLGVTLVSVQREDEAERCYRIALTLDPNHRKAQFNLAYLLLRQGRLEEGWGLLEARDWYEPFERMLPYPRWRGESLAGKTILMCLEAGHGDTIQFSRYASLLKRAGAANVSLLCQPALERLLRGLPGLDAAFATDELPAPGDFDYWVPVLSLPHWFGTTLATIPATIPYLFAEVQRVEDWNGRMAGTDTALKVGLAWKGNPRFENDAERSLPSLATLAPLMDVTGARFFSLQKGPGEDEIASHAAAWPLVPLGHLVDDFADTAAIVMNLDLVITVDTAVAHLAGALGKDCWVLLPRHSPDWRWLDHRSDSPWYPGVVRLYRQSLPGNWAPTIQTVKVELERRARLI